MNFKSIEIEDRHWVEPLLAESGFQGNDYTFGNLYIWNDLYRQQVAKEQEMLCVRSRNPGTGEYKYLFPAGAGNLEAVIEALSQDAKALGVDFVLRGFGEKEAVLLEQLFPNRFQIESVREEWDYLYKVEDLTMLSGKKFHKQRNHLARFEKGPEWSFAPLGADNMEACRRMCEIWYGEHLAGGNTAALMDRGVVENALEYFEKLGFTGGVLFQGGVVVAFTIGEPLNQDTYAVHIEKAFAEVQGAYPMINREYLKSVATEYTYVNREEDDGVEGLRKAKESYYPILLKKFVAREVK